MIFLEKRSLRLMMKDLGIRGNEISMIFQEPMTALNPVMTIGKQIDEIFRYHSKMSPKERVGKATQLLNDVHLPDPSTVSYTHLTLPTS